VALGSRRLLALSGLTLLLQVKMVLKQAHLKLAMSIISLQPQRTLDFIAHMLRA
jgi:hypothetical protein